MEPTTYCRLLLSRTDSHCDTRWYSLVEKGDDDVYTFVGLVHLTDHNDGRCSPKAHLGRCESITIVATRLLAPRYQCGAAQRRRCSTRVRHSRDPKDHPTSGRSGSPWYGGPDGELLAAVSCGDEEARAVTRHLLEGRLRKEVRLVLAQMYNEHTADKYLELYLSLLLGDVTFVEAGQEMRVSRERARVRLAHVRNEVLKRLDLN